MDLFSQLNHVFSLIVQQERQFMSENGEVLKALLTSTSASGNQSGAGVKKSSKGKFVKNQQGAKPIVFVAKMASRWRPVSANMDFHRFLKRDKDWL